MKKLTDQILLKDVPVSGMASDGVKYITDLKTYRTGVFTINRIIIQGVEDFIWQFGYMIGLGFFNKRKKISVTLIDPNPYTVSFSIFYPKGFLGFVDRRAIKYYVEKKGWVPSTAGSTTNAYISGVKLGTIGKKVFSIPEEAVEQGLSITEYQMQVKEAFIAREKEKRLPIYIEHDMERNNLSKEEATEKWEKLLEKRRKSEAQVTKYEKEIHKLEVEGA